MNLERIGEEEDDLRNAQTGVEIKKKICVTLLKKRRCLRAAPRGMEK